MDNSITLRNCISLHFITTKLKKSQSYNQTDYYRRFTGILSAGPPISKLTTDLAVFAP